MRGRPKKINDEVIAALLRFGVKPGVVALAFHVHPKTVERAKRRFDEEIQPTIQRLTQALTQISNFDCFCENAGDHDCAPCLARGALES